MPIRFCVNGNYWFEYKQERCDGKMQEREIERKRERENRSRRKPVKREKITNKTRRLCSIGTASDTTHTCATMRARPHISL